MYRKMKTIFHSTHGNIPEGYEELLHWRITTDRQKMIRLQSYAIQLFLICMIFFGCCTILLGAMPPVTSLQIHIQHLIFLVGGSAFILVLHEIIHGLCMKFFGANPSYGAVWNYFILYATSPKYAFTLSQYTIIALFPFIIISISAIISIVMLKGTTWVLIIILMAAIHGGGAAGDLWIAAILCKYPIQAYVIDEKDGFCLFLPEDSKP